MIQASLKLEWTDTHSTKVREYADRDSEKLSYLFTNTQDFLKQTIATLMDEPSTRESLNNVIVGIQAPFPFLLINEYRVAH